MRIKFSNNIQTDFFSTLKSRVDGYFEENKISKNANFVMILKTIFFLGNFFLIYGLIISNTFSPVSMLGMCFLLGLFTAFIGFNVSHDAVHGSYSSNKTINKILGYTFDFLGASSYLWSIMHNIIHHTFTNIPEHDDDLEPVFFIRLSKTKKLYKIHRYQHWYATLFYGLTSFSWVFLKDYKKMFTTQFGNYTVKKHPLKELLIIFFSKAIYYFIFIILPILVLSVSWWQVLLGFFVMHFAQGVTLAIVFQLAHVVEDVEFPQPSAEGNIENNWAIHQINTTSNFARKSFLANWFFGGLNFQIEHHLFPTICHVHYKRLSEIVKNTANEFNITYNENRTMLEAIFSHYKMLKKLGREPQIV